MQLETTLIAKAICKTIEKIKAIQVLKTTGIAKTIEKTKKIRKPRFQNQWVAKTIEKTKKKEIP